MSQRTFRNESRDDYLEAILIIRQKKGFCRSTDIASWLGSLLAWDFQAFGQRRARQARRAGTDPNGRG